MNNFHPIYFYIFLTCSIRCRLISSSILCSRTYFAHFLNEKLLNTKLPWEYGAKIILWPPIFTNHYFRPFLNKNSDCGNLDWKNGWRTAWWLILDIFAKNKDNGKCWQIKRWWRGGQRKDCFVPPLPADSLANKSPRKHSPKMCIHKGFGRLFFLKIIF